MTEEELKRISETVDGFPVKDLRFKTVDNIIVGLVKCPILGKPFLHDGFVSGAWRRDGTPTNRIKGRSDLKLKIIFAQ